MASCVGCLAPLGEELKSYDRTRCAKEPYEESQDDHHLLPDVADLQLEESMQWQDEDKEVPKDLPSCQRAAFISLRETLTYITGGSSIDLSFQIHAMALMLTIPLSPRLLSVRDRTYLRRREYLCYDSHMKVAGIAEREQR